jgi:hypothetical protein
MKAKEKENIPARVNGIPLPSLPIPLQPSLVVGPANCKKKRGGQIEK